jgi:hypothetical protein
MKVDVLIATVSVHTGAAGTGTFVLALFTCTNKQEKQRRETMSVIE